MTIADQIRKLDDERLALVLYLAAWGSANRQWSQEEWLEWLKEEIEHDGL